MCFSTRFARILGPTSSVSRESDLIRVSSRRFPSRRERESSRKDKDKDKDRKKSSRRKSRSRSRSSSSSRRHRDKKKSSRDSGGGGRDRCLPYVTFEAISEISEVCLFFF